MVLGTPEADALGTHHAGWLVGHERPGWEVRCEGAVSVDPCPASDSRHRWIETGTLEGGDLTLVPSILCQMPGRDGAGPCGFHGFVRNGGWVPA